MADDGEDVREITVCPECDSSEIKVTATGSIENGDPERGKFRCGDCGHRFDEPATREARVTPSTHGLAKKLDDAPPDASWEELAGDGGASS